MAEKYQAAVRHIINTRSDSIDWSKAMNLIDVLNRSRTYDREIFGAIHQLSVDGDRRIKLNAISFIDALFKNGNSGLLTELQRSRSILGIADSKVISDPYVHRVLCSAAEGWTSACQMKRCLENQFLDWQRQLFSFKYKYVMTPKMQKKFSEDFSTAFELLIMFSQALIQALHDGTGTDDMLTEMVTNVIEVLNRLRELETTMNDKYVLSIIHYLEDFCEICKQSFSSLSTNGMFEVDILTDIAKRGIPKPDEVDSRQQMQPPPGPVPFQMNPGAPPSNIPFQPPPIPQSQQPAPPPQPQFVDDLLDLSFAPTTPAQNQPPTMNQTMQMGGQPPMYNNFNQQAPPNFSQPIPNNNFQPPPVPSYNTPMQQTQQQFNPFQQPMYPPPQQNNQQPKQNNAFDGFEFADDI